jgi:hypothetical protein
MLPDSSTVSVPVAAVYPLFVCLQIAAPVLSHLPSGSRPSAPASTYSGGYLAALSPGAEPTLAVAFEAKGGLSDIKATATAAGVCMG